MHCCKSVLFTKVNVQLFHSKASQCLGIVLFRKINTKSSRRKGKQISIRRRYNIQQQTSMPIVEKSAASFMKKFNYENKLLFGEVLKKPSIPTSKKNSVISETSQNLTYNDDCLLIQDVESTLQLSEISDSILKFPLMDKIDKNDTEKMTLEFNSVRQWLKKTCQEKNMPSVTSILESTMPPEQAMVLERWKASMIKELGVEGFKTYQQELFFNGSTLHQTINGYLSRIPEMKTEVRPANAGHWKSLQFILPQIQDVKLLEERIVHPFLHYKGMIDCLGEYKKQLVVVDWKTSKKPKLSLSHTYDNPLQIAAYVGALNFDPKFKYMVNQGLIVIAYENGSQATVHHMSNSVLLDYWKKWLCRLKLYYDKMYCSVITQTD